jgi:hypothetical protein
MAHLRLFVVGEESADPAQWSSRRDHAIVLARCQNEARSIADLPRRDAPVTEIAMNQSMVLAIYDSGDTEILTL